MHRYLFCFALPIILLTWGCGLSGDSAIENASDLQTTRIPPVLVAGIIVCHEEFKCFAELKNTHEQAQQCNLSLHVKSRSSSNNEALLWSEEVTGIEIDPDSIVRVIFDFRESLGTIRDTSGDQSYSLVGPLPDPATGRCIPVPICPGSPDCEPTCPGSPGCEQDPPIIDLAPNGQPKDVAYATRQTRLIRFNITEPGPYVMETQGSLDTMMELHAALNRDTPGNYLASDDDNGHSGNARISETLSRGTYFLKLKLKSPHDSGSSQILVRPADSAGGWCNTYNSTPEQRHTMKLLQDSVTRQTSCESTYQAIKRTETIRLDNTSVKDLSPLGEFSHLKRLYLMNTQVRDLSSLAGMTNMVLLFFDNTRVSDLSPLRNLRQLKALGLPFTSIHDLTPLYDLSSLTYVDMTGVQVSTDAVNQLRMRLPNALIRH